MFGFILHLITTFPSDKVLWPNNSRKYPRQSTEGCQEGSVKYVFSGRPGWRRWECRGPYCYKVSWFILDTGQNSQTRYFFSDSLSIMRAFRLCVKSVSKRTWSISAFSLEEEYILQWNDHKYNFFSLAADDVFRSEEMTDITVCCGDQMFDAHKLILSVCSPLFRSMISRCVSRLNNQHPIIFLKASSSTCRTYPQPKSIKLLRSRVV